MLVIRDTQMAAFKQSAREALKRRLVDTLWQAYDLHERTDREALAPLAEAAVEAGEADRIGTPRLGMFGCRRVG